MFGGDALAGPILLALDLLLLLFDHVALFLPVDGRVRHLVIGEVLIVHPCLLWDGLAGWRDVIVLAILLGLSLEEVAEHLESLVVCVCLGNSF